MVCKAWWTVERELAGREIFTAIVENLMGFVVLLDLRRHDRHRQPKAIFQYNHREFDATGKLLQHHARVHPPAKEQFHFFDGLGWRRRGEHPDAAASSRWL